MIWIGVEEGGVYVFQDLILIEILFLFAKCSAQNYLFRLFKDGGWSGVVLIVEEMKKNTLIS